MSVLRLRFSPGKAAGLLALLAVGCGGPAVSPVSGTVLYKEQPLTGAAVIFTPQEGNTAGKLALGVTDEHGKYRLRTELSPSKSYEGAVPGEYRVTISKEVPPRGMSEEEYQKLVAAEEHKPGNEPSRVPLKEQLLPECATLEKTKLTATVQSGSNDIPFKLP